jgi:hypothetical protein
VIEVGMPSLDLAEGGANPFRDRFEFSTSAALTSR